MGICGEKIPRKTLPKNLKKFVWSASPLISWDFGKFHMKLFPKKLFQNKLLSLQLLMMTTINDAGISSIFECFNLIPMTIDDDITDDDDAIIITDDNWWWHHRIWMTSGIRMTSQMMIASSIQFWFGICDVNPWLLLIDICNNIKYTKKQNNNQFCIISQMTKTIYFNASIKSQM